ncbi:MAG: type I DNA topoisomerase [Tissierellia bacterium]|nr:type I DNA topoisomerase [Tissierellia bacterium]
MKNLVIVESPTKAKTIKKLLGRNYKVLATVGHIRDLPKSSFGVDIENNFEPKYITIRGKGPVIKDLKKEAKKADHIYLATDPDREGEAISWHLSHILDLNPDDNIRVEFNEITKDTVKEQIHNPRSIDSDLVDAQQARRVLDRIVGYKISPLLWKKVKGKLSAGRVQSVVLKIICDREEEIRNFIPEEYWTIEANLIKDKKTFKASYYGRYGAAKDEKIELKTKEDAQKVLHEINHDFFHVADIKTKDKKRFPFHPFTTSTLQQEASRKLNFKGKKTMRIAQSLYEGIDIPKEGSVGLITYMRTDSVRVSADAASKTKDYILKEFGKEYLGFSKKPTKTKKGVQDAHECIRPTDVTRTPENIKNSLSRDEFRLYQLIWKRFVSSQMSPAIFKTMTIRLTSNNHVFRTSGNQKVFDGFLKVYHYAEQKDTILPSLNLEDSVKVKKIIDEQHFTNPPPRYNEASLIKLLEELRIGRPSTYSPTISTIQSRYYVTLEDKKFHPTELGETVNEILTEYFPDLVNEKFTASMEEDLDTIAHGEMYWKQLVKDVYNQLKEDLDKAHEEVEKVEIRDQLSNETCEKCGRTMVIKMGPYGKFLACPGFPECRNTMPYEERIGVECPKCKEGEVVIKRSKKGRKFYGCNQYPKCDFVSWNEPVSEPCPKCNGVLTKHTTKKGSFLKCQDPSCGYMRELEEQGE